MALFRRRRSADSGASTDGIGEFWSWWNDGGAGEWGRVAGQGIPPQELIDDLNQRLERIAPGLAWELAAGSESVHQLIVTAEGDPALRAPARRWLLAAPPSDPIWSYADSRPERADVSAAGVEFDGYTVDASQAQVGVRRAGSRVDVTMYHPAFADMAEKQRGMAMFILLDQTLGERQVETWVGEVGTSEVPPLDGFGLSGLRSVVRDLAAEHVGEDGEPVWALLQGESPTGPVIASAQVPLAAAQWPLFDQYVRVELAYADRNPDGLPGEGALAALRALEEAVTGAVDEDGRLVAHETTGGLRALHVYVDSTSGATARVSDVAKRWDGKARVSDEHDPGWSAVQHLRG